MGRRSGAALTRDDLVAAAIRVLERRGVDALGTASVASELGIRPPSVYHHFEGNDALRFAAATEGWRRLLTALPEPSTDGSASLAEYARAYRAFALANRALYQLMTTTPFDPTDPALLEVAARAADVLAPLRLEGDDVLHGLRGLRAAIHGFVALELAGQVQLALPADTSFEWLIQRLIRP
jgi:AcrR family transcriptional regulator